jgi:cyanophycin synthetase
VVLEEQIRGHMITLYDRGTHLPLVWTHLIPATLEGRAMHNVQNAMFAGVMAYAMGVKVENIRQGLRTFDSTFFQAPGRLNVYDKLPFKVILDYGHNPAAMQAMTDLVKRLDVAGRRIGVVSAPGDRRDEDIQAIARAAAAAFDHVIFRRDEDQRGRGEREVPMMMAQAVRDAGVPADRVDVIVDEQASIDFALKMAQPGDLLVIFGDNITRSWKQIIYFKGDEPALESETPAAVTAPPPPPRRESSEPQRDGVALIADERGVRLARETDD